MDRSYVEDYIVNSVKKIDASLTKDETDALIDSILFDWNEIGDPEADFESVVEWNVENFARHAKSGKKDNMIKIDLTEVRDYITYPKDWFGVSYKPKPKYFMIKKSRLSDYDDVFYFLDKKENDSKYNHIKGYDESNNISD